MIRCTCCGRTWRDSADMRASTDPVGVCEYDGIRLELVNCPCTSTRVVPDDDPIPPTMRDPGLHPAETRGSP